jgi:SAM-dependent MidA family methyltransferase
MAEFPGDTPAPPPQSARSAPAETEIRARIGVHGRITFAEFMELALYHPTGGYYTSGSPVGASGDYYTSPSAHPAFGAALAVMLRNMWEALERPSPFHVIEMGAGDGLLARDITAFIPALSPQLVQDLHYVALDRTSPIPNRAPDTTTTNRVAATGAPLRNIVGCILSNELIDAFPVALFEVRDGIPKEIYITLQDGELREVLDDPNTPELIQAIAGLDHKLPGGYRGEVNLGMATWIDEASQALDRGFVVTIDYGHAGADPYPPRRADGTLRTHRNHTAGNNPLRHVGEQDITTHVDFAALDRLGTESGLSGIGIVSQADLLGALGINRWLYSLRRMELAQPDLDANMMAMRDIIRPGGLGDFGILVQQKNTETHNLEQLLPAEKEDLPPPPLLDPAHTPLLEGSYPHATWHPPQTWNTP